MILRALVVLLAVLAAPTAAAFPVEFSLTEDELYLEVGLLADAPVVVAVDTDDGSTTVEGAPLVESEALSVALDAPLALVEPAADAFILDAVAELPLLAPAEAAAAPAPARVAAPAAESVAADEPQAPALAAGASLALGVVASVAAVGAAGSAFTFPWERLRRLGLLAFLYTRIARERLLDHEARETLLDAVRARPGASLTEVAQAANLPRNTAVYHLTRLEKESLVRSVRQGRSRLYFAPGALERADRADALAALRHPTTRSIATEVGASPGLDQQTLCARFGLAPSLAHWHANRLVSTGIVERRRDGRHVRYYPGAAYGLVTRPLGE